MKRISLLTLTALLLAALTLFSGCSDFSAADTPADGETITIVDHAGASVTLPAHIERIAVCDSLPLPSVLSVFFDSADKLVAIAPASMTAAKNGLLSELYPEILNADPSAMSGLDVNPEELLKLDPQVVFYSADNVPMGETLRKAGLNAVAISASNWGYNAVETLSQWIELLSQIFPEAGNDRAERVRAYSEEALALVRERTESLSERESLFFLFQYSEDAILTSGSSFFGQWWADAVGAVNCAAELEGDKSVKVTLEQIYKWNPDKILVTNFTPAAPEDLWGNTVGSYDWSGIRAVEEQEVYKMPLGMYRSYTAGVDTPVTLLWLAKTVYPALFEDVDITEKTVEYYRDVFGVTLTEEQAASLFAPADSAGKTDF